MVFGKDRRVPQLQISRWVGEVIKLVIDVLVYKQSRIVKRHKMSDKKVGVCLWMCGQYK